MEKKNLDNLFKEKFKDFSETPDIRVWEKIEASLDKKKKKRVVPIWWQLGGVAAAIALLLYFINPFASNDEQLVPSVVNTENNTTNKNQNELEKNTEDSDVFKETNESQITGVTDISSENTLNEEEKAAENSAIPQKNSNLTTPQNVTRSTEPALANIEKQKSLNREPEKPQKANTNQNTLFNADAIAENDEKKKNKSDNFKKPEEENEVAVAENATKEDEKISIFDAIAEQENLEDEALAEYTGKRWSMGPSVAPVFFSSIGEGSPIHSNFAANSKSGNLNLSYGLTVSYNINEKLSIRSGVHRVDYGYDTNDIVFTSSLTTSTNQLIDNITYAQTSRNLVVQSGSAETQVSSNPATSGAAQPFEGSMVQQLGYVEVPMELNYALLDKKFGINLIGGVSSLFLVDNAVSLVSEDFITEMGRANNANDFSFSTNIGVGLNYEITQKLQFNVEPIFKYQLNTFSETAGNFRPYSVGVYSGLNFRF